MNSSDYPSCWQLDLSFRSSGRLSHDTHLGLLSIALVNIFAPGKPVRIGWEKFLAMTDWAIPKDVD